MSIYDRDYIRNQKSGNSATGPKNWSIVIWLVAINVAVFLLNNLFFYSKDRDWFGLSIEALESFRFWTPLTYQFVHASPWHLLGNMLGLFFLGRMLLELTGPRQVLQIYLLGGFAGGGLQLLYNAIFGPDAAIVGASASVLAIVIAVAAIIPHRSIQMLLFFIIPVTLTLKQVAYVIVGVNVLTFLFSLGAPGSERDGIAVMAHFGGMLLGWAFIHYGFHHSSAASRSPRKPMKERFGIRVIRDSDSPDPGIQGSDAAKRKPFVTSDVDAILDKINEHGFQSLSAEERRTLEQSSRKLSDRIDRNL
ncbi:MAG: rhomboid family intramembrane serine protease [Verrucomicrobiales bacterium]|nr:rhomboid family intramembrane serine protease [Verrucomicrobiales bacterium]